GQIASADRSLRMPAHAFTTAIGTCSIEWSGENVTGFSLPAIKADDPPSVPASDTRPVWIGELSQRVRAHLDGDLQDFADVPFAFEQVASFQRAVLIATLSVKAGRTAS